MKKKFLVMLGICMVASIACFVVTSYASYEIGPFISPKGDKGDPGNPGADCNPTETRVRCGPNLTVKCYENNEVSQKTGVKIERSSCPAGGSPIVSYLFDNECGVTVKAVTDVHQDNDVAKPVTHKRVTFKNTCTNTELSEHADVPVGTDGAACGAEVVTTACGPEGVASVRCADTTKRGIKVEHKNCLGQMVDADTQYIYNGDDGTSFKYMGTVPNCDALENIFNPAQNDAYIVNGDGNGKLCIYNGSAWPTCPSGCAEFTGPAGANNCTGFENSNTAVRNTTLVYDAPIKTNQSDAYYTGRGGIFRTNVMCNPNLTNTIEKLEDTCFQIVKPTNSACTGVYMECTPKGTYEGNTSYSKYNLCEAATGTTIESALNGKEDALCVGNNANSSNVERKKTVEYSEPTGDGSGGGYFWKTSIGGLENKSVKCDDSSVPIGFTPDKCEEIERPNSNVCTGNGNVYYRCTKQNDNTTKYNLCASGTSVLDKISTAQSAAASAASAASAANPCASNPNSNTIIKSTTSTSYSRGTKSNGLYPDIGSKTVTKTACDGTTTYTTTEQDFCVEIAKPVNVCTGATSAYLRCYNDQVSSDKTYHVCQDLGTGNNSLANKIDAKADASAVTLNALATTLGDTYLKPTDNINASNLTGTINAERLPGNVLTTDNIEEELERQLDEGGSLENVVTNGNIADKLAEQLESGGALEDVVTTSNLANRLAENNADAVFDFGTSNITFSEVVELLHAVIGDCAVTNNNNQRTVTCSNGVVGQQVQVDRQIGTP